MKRLFFLITLLLLALILLFSLISCKKEAEFDTLLICDEIDEKTLEAVNIKNVFEIDNETIYAVIKYSGAYMKDSYFFVWTNLDTGKKKTTEKYFFANKENLESGNLVSVLRLKEESPAITPGKYKVEFIYNGNLKSTSEFEISRPEMKIITTELASKLSEDGSPFESTEKFEQTDTINLSINVNYILKNNNFKIRWFDNKDKIIKENLYVVNKDDYKNKYITFPLQSGKGLFPEGDYEVDIYFNEALIKTLSFNIKK
ncbi:MAG: hypothetical protein PHU65_08195 [Actinomycetota bacterium]|nr:hypothetical protein [Actinomycetota bacterium]